MSKGIDQKNRPLGVVDLELFLAFGLGDIASYVTEPKDKKSPSMLVGGNPSLSQLERKGYLETALKIIILKDVNLNCFKLDKY